ncbi:MAG TPA: NAD(P)H-dependent oxidoreductase [Nocardioidaceae bacterium]|nr:NAD(P)H-dependent oxidoreductase [Nocardioidaceae bacterium]
MAEQGWQTDVWPAIFEQVLAADILVLAGPIWLGDNSSVMKRVIEWLYGCSSLLNDAGQYACYGRVGGCVITGDEDGIKHCAMKVLYGPQHWRHPGVREPAQRVGRRLRTGPGQPRAPIADNGKERP